jgi:regulator of protease activity HflC (stomatin/prohibitin superfamily)
MFNVGFFKAQPTEYVIEFRDGRVVREGHGLAFYYLQHNTHLAVVPTTRKDVEFVFAEVTADFQTVTLQGQFSYQVADPRRVAALLNYTIDPRRRAYVSDDPERLSQRVGTVIQLAVRTEIQRRPLAEALRLAESVAAAVLQRVREGDALADLGVELRHVYVLAIKPTPEVAKALEAEYRESLLRRADEAIYARRAAAVDEEHKIRETELNSQVALEEQRLRLIDWEGSNAQREAEYRGRAVEQEAAYRARALEQELAVYRALDPPTILALAFKELGHNAGRVGNLTITSEILAALLNGRTSPPQPDAE